MTAFSVNEPFPKGHSDVYVWHCEDCHCLHIRAGETLLTFTSAEFAAFAEAVSKCYRQQKESSLSDGAPEETPEAMINSLATN